MTASQEQRRAAHLAAERIVPDILAMLEAGDVGEVGLKILSPYEIKPFMRVEKEGPIVKVARGQATVIGKVNRYP